MSYPIIQLSRRESKQLIKPGKLRRQGIIPGVVYGKGTESISVQIPETDIEAFLKTSDNIAEVEIDGKKKELVHLARFERDILTHKLQHYAFHILVKGQKSTFTIPIRLVGEAPGVKDGGIVNQVMDEVDVECIPSKAPKSLELDISGLNLEENLSLGKIQLPEGVEFYDADVKETVVTCNPPKKEVEPEPDTETAEVEVIGEEKSESESAEASGKKADDAKKDSE